MSLVFSAVLPHSPLLVPNIGKENLAQFSLTNEAKEKIMKDFTEAKVDSVIIITTKGPMLLDSFTVNVSPEFRANLEIFGDLVTRWEFSGDITLAGRLREKLENQSKIMMVTNNNLNYAASISLSLLSTNLHQPIVPITVGTDLSPEEIISLGKKIQGTILEDNLRIAVIVAADLSHRVNKKSPQGYSPKGKKFDQKIVEALKAKDVKTILENFSLAREVACDDLPCLTLLSGILDDVGLEAKILSYEAPFGTGHAIVEYVSPFLPTPPLS
jgi:aromatic ring-opening dioxygenase LigB subunit